MKILRNLASMPGVLNGLVEFCGIETNTDGGGTKDYVIETRATKIVFAIGYAGTTLIAPTIAASTVFLGTEKVTFVIPASGVLKYHVYGSNGYQDNGSGTVDVTFTENEVF